MFIVSCMLTERRLVFHSESLEKVSDVIHGLLKLLYPFEWQQVCIPILPKSLMHYVGAPMPFIIGLPTSAIEEVSNYGVSTVSFGFSPHLYKTTIFYQIFLKIDLL